MGTDRKNVRREWTTTEVKFMKQNYGFMLVKDIAKHLNRTEHSVRTYASRVLKIRSAMPRRPNPDTKIIKHMIYEGYHPSQIAKAVNTSTKALYNRVRDGKRYDRLDYRVLLKNRQQVGRIARVKKVEDQY